MSSNSKRTHPRAPIEIKVEYQRLNSFFADYSRDISRGGLFIQTDSPSDVGESCYLTLSFPKYDEPITLLAVVKHVVPADDDSGNPGMGLEFNFESAEEKKALARVVDHMMIEHLGVELYEKLSASAAPDTTSLSAVDATD